MIGEQNYETITKISQQGTILAEKLISIGKPILVLVDISNQKSLPSRVHQATVDSINNNPFERIALFGADKYLRVAVNMLITAIGQGNRIKLFGTPGEAEAWLTSYPGLD